MKFADSMFWEGYRMGREFANSCNAETLCQRYRESMTPQQLARVDVLLLNQYSTTPMSVLPASEAVKLYQAVLNPTIEQRCAMVIDELGRLIASIESDEHVTGAVARAKAVLGEVVDERV